jgi:hypothetical protein
MKADGLPQPQKRGSITLTGSRSSGQVATPAAAPILLQRHAETIERGEKGVGSCLHIA